MNQRVVVGYDGSTSSEEATRWAAAEAASRDVDLLIVTCYALPVTAELSGAWLASEAHSAMVDTAAALSQQMRATISAAYPALRVTSEVVAGPAGVALVSDVDAGDLLVVGSTNHEGLATLVLGNTARWVARHSPCPAIVVRGAASRGRPDRIVVGIDGSATSMGALLWAADEADHHGVPLVVVHSWEYVYLGADGSTLQARDLTRVDASCTLDRAVELASQRCGVEVTGVLVEDTAARGLLKSVRDGDLLVLGSRGRGAVRSGLFGSTVNGLLEYVSVPVAVVHPTAVAASVPAHS